FDDTPAMLRRPPQGSGTGKEAGGRNRYSKCALGWLGRREDDAVFDSSADAGAAATRNPTAWLGGRRRTPTALRRHWMERKRQRQRLRAADIRRELWWLARRFEGSVLREMFSTFSL
ncbi:hypothetical protein VIGAN_02220300, partial [Vigna angularis var. angularis]